MSLSSLSPSDLADLELHRQQFLAFSTNAYFNYGGQGPMPTSAIDAIQQAHEWVQRSGPFSAMVNRQITQETEQIRAALATELGTTPTTLTLTENVSVGCNIALWGIDWHAGDHILLSDCEHQSVIGTVLELQRRFGIHFSTCPIMETLNQGDPLDVIAQHLQPNTRLAAISHVLWNTGQLLPIAQIADLCHRYPTQTGPIRLLVDAAQSVGMLPLKLDELGVDFYAFTGHKWLCGPAGLGGLYIHPDAFPRLKPTFIGWRGLIKNSSGYPTGLYQDGRQFEVATSDYTLYAGLQAALTVHQQWGTAEQRYRRIIELSRYLWQQLMEIPFIHCLKAVPPETGLVSFQVQNRQPDTHHRLVQFLEQRQFLLRTLLDPSCVRACVHYLTLESEIDRLVETIREFQ